MRVSITFVLAVCAPLLALAAPISLNPPANAVKPGAEAKGFPLHAWKRDEVVHTDAYTGQGWKRDPPAEDYPNHEWKRQGGSASVASGPGGFNKPWKA